jgi:hypothetical protein
MAIYLLTFQSQRIFYPILNIERDVLVMLSMSVSLLTIERMTKGYQNMNVTTQREILVTSSRRIKVLTVADLKPPESVFSYIFLMIILAVPSNGAHNSSL